MKRKKCFDHEICPVFVIFVPIIQLSTAFFPALKILSSKKDRKKREKTAVRKVDYKLLVKLSTIATLTFKSRKTETTKPFQHKVSNPQIPSYSDHSFLVRIE